MKGYTVWDCRLNANTMNFDGLEWVVDGERGRYTFPGSIPECLAVRLYANGLSNVPCVGYCDGCAGSEKGRICKKEIC